MQEGKKIIEGVQLTPDRSDLNVYLNLLVEGFSKAQGQLSQSPDAISFAFPGPADYPNGIIGDLPNFPVFQGGVALKDFLEHKFSIPTFINNNGDLFTYGEAMAGLLPKVNGLLKESGASRRYRNLIGIMLGKGAGGGLVVDGQMHIGDNAASTEIWCMRSKKIGDTIFEDSVNSQAVVRVYKELSNAVGNLTMQDVHNIALGKQDGNRDAAQQSFAVLGEVLGDGIANILCVVDGLVVIGGVVADANQFFLNSLVEEINSTFNTIEGEPVIRTELTAFNLMEERSRNSFLRGSNRKIVVPQTDITVDYDPVKRTGVGVSVLGTEQAIELGAYYYALAKLK
ncbi:hypothetical protein AGMMS4956_06940 [Bacteroidia bacterium]|nr:hypothetical protein AGMMS4956_06940 [Bacteroidia bacterium]